MILAETELEKRILNDPRIQEGFKYTKFTKGHPEGNVAIHVQQILDFINRQNWQEYRRDLRIITLIHDSFKYVQAQGGKFHAVLAAEYYAALCPDDKRISEAIHYHDSAWGFYNKLKRGEFDAKKFKKTFSKLDLSLLIHFNYADDCGRENITPQWFEEKIRELNLPNVPERVYETLQQ